MLQAFNTPPPKREGSGELVVGLWGQPPSPSDKVTMIRQSSLTRLGVMINTAVNKRSSHSESSERRPLLIRPQTWTPFYHWIFRDSHFEPSHGSLPYLIVVYSSETSLFLRRWRGLSSY
ncbi:hypothetical protein J6590_049654 [Homalodisca vitripennis]|nr:hypothetical protein J6590_049654 [Homalodisca vitripennis]